MKARSFDVVVIEGTIPDPCLGNLGISSRGISTGTPPPSQFRKQCRRRPRAGQFSTLTTAGGAAYAAGTPADSTKGRRD